MFILNAYPRVLRRRSRPPAQERGRRRRPSHERRCADGSVPPHASLGV